MSVETRYFCTGSCGAVTTQEKYDQGLTKCGEKSCNMCSRPFISGLFCKTCKTKITDQEIKRHEH
jgi:hypothetical protein